MPAEARATIPGTVSVVHVQDGSQVLPGDVIMEIECMKSLWAVTAPATGTVSLKAALGEMVAQDQVVATIE